MPLPEILYDYARLMLFNERDETQTRDLSREYLGYLRNLEPARFAGFSNLETNPIHLGTPYLPITQAQAIVALATFMRFPTLARELAAEFPGMLPLQNGVISVVSRIILNAYDASSASDLTQRWERFRNFMRDSRAQEAAGFRFSLVPTNLEPNFRAIHETLGIIEETIAVYVRSMHVSTSLSAARFKIDLNVIENEISTIPFPDTVQGCFEKISSLTAHAADLLEGAESDPRYATQQIRATLRVKALIIRSGHLLLERLRDVPKSTGTADYRPIFKGRLERLAEFMQIDADEISPFAANYQSENQKQCDAHEIETDSMSVQVRGKEVDIVCNCCMNVMDNPVKLPSGHYIEWEFLKRLFAGALTAEDPYSRATITREILVVDVEVKAAIDAAVQHAVKPEAKKASLSI